MGNLKILRSFVILFSDLLNRLESELGFITVIFSLFDGFEEFVLFGDAFRLKNLEKKVSFYKFKNNSKNINSIYQYVNEYITKMNIIQ